MRHRVRGRAHRVLGLALALVSCALVTADGRVAGSTEAIQKETLLQTRTAWDGTTYRAYPSGDPQIDVLRITIPARTTMDWHRHPMPNAAYVATGAITVETQDGRARQRFTKGQVIAETVNVAHRGVTGDEPVELIVFYAGAAGQALSEPAANAASK
jgi:quercetin dioxygenase-like cupin family protein